MARADVFVHALAAQVEVAVFHPQILVGKLPVEVEGQHVGLVEHFAFGGDDFDIAGRQLGVFGAGETRGDFAGDLQHILITQRVALCGQFSVFFRAEHDLGQSFAVAQVDEDDAAVVAGRIHPATQRDGLADVLCADGVAMKGAEGVGDHG